MSQPVEISTTARRVAVVGGGLVGAAAALLAERSGAQVYLFEPQEVVSAPEHGPGDALTRWPIRHVALAPASLALLQRLGVDDRFNQGVFRRMRVWEALGTASLQFEAAEVAQAELGRMAELPGLQAALWRRVRQVRGIRVHQGTPVTALEARADGSWNVQQGARHYRADLVLAADGARSMVCQLLGVTVRSMPTGHHALVTVARMEQAHDQVARQRFLQEGPLALLPTLDPYVVSIVWSQSQTDAERRMRLSERDFCTALTRASEAVLGAVCAIGQRAAFPISQQLAHSFVPAPGVALLGDAGRVLHPLAGLGVNLGFEDVATLQTVLDGDSPAAWAAWSRQRRARSQLVQTALTGLQRAYGSSGPVMALLRNTGVRWLGQQTRVKRVLMREALGL